MHHLRNLKTAVATGLLASSVMLMAIVTAHAQDDIELVDLAAVQTIVIDDGNATVINQAEQLTLNAVSTKASYKVNEPIRFNIITNQNAYVYILSTEPTGKTVMVYPNQVDKNNFLNANIKQMVPSANAFSAPLFSDRAGQEAFTIIASTQPLNITDLFNVINSGHMTASTDDVQNILADYGIDIGASSHTANPNVAMQKININVVGGSITVENPTVMALQAMPSVVAKTKNGNILMLSTNKSSYQANDAVTVTYAATGSNYVNLAIRLQDGSIKTLKTYKSSNKLRQLRFIMPNQLDSVMLWESKKRSTNELPRADESVYLNLTSN